MTTTWNWNEEEIRAMKKAQAKIRDARACTDVIQWARVHSDRAVTVREFNEWNDLKKGIVSMNLHFRVIEHLEREGRIEVLRQASIGNLRMFATIRVIEG